MKSIMPDKQALTRKKIIIEAKVENDEAKIVVII